MNPLMEQGILQEQSCGEQLAYLLADSKSFSSTDYKVLQNQSGGPFLRCVRASCNGYTQLWYLSGGYQRLADRLPHMDADAFLTFSLDLLKAVSWVRDNGFLSCTHTELSLERVFLNGADHSVQLLYFPLHVPVYETQGAFEEALRTLLSEALQLCAWADETQRAHFAAALAKPGATIETLGGIICAERENACAARKRLCLVGQDVPEPVKFVVDKDVFLIGKKLGSVDGVITFNKTISRVHCKINRTPTGYTVTDLESVNGTYINGHRLESNQAVPLSDGDVLRLANTDLKVEIS